MILASSAQAQENRQKMSYDVYTGGIHVVEAALDMGLAPERYNMFLQARTRGFLGKVAPWEGSFESAGWTVAPGDYRPEVHKSTAIWQGEKETKEYRYTRDRNFKELIVKDHDKPVERETPSEELTQGTTDALTATLVAMEQVAAGQKCEGTSEVFDGKRRFRMMFRHQGYEDLKASRYNIFEGRAAVCTVEIEPVAGAWHSKPRGWLSIQEQGRARGTMPTIWVASLSDGTPAVPVKTRVKTAFGTLFMHLTGHTSSNPYAVME